MVSPPVQVFLGFVAYAAVHSALLTDTARSVLEGLLGTRRFRGVFRFGFSVLAVGSLVVYVVWVAGLPDVGWTEASGGVAWFLLLLRWGAFGYLLLCVGRFGAGEFLGWNQFRAWRRGEAVSGDGMDAGELVVGGPYRWVRHPMYSAGMVILWAEPRWSANRFAFVLAATLYLWIGSAHEERRLARFYGEAYRRYRARTPRFIPSLWSGHKNR